LGLPEWKAVENHDLCDLSELGWLGAVHLIPESSEILCELELRCASLGNMTTRSRLYYRYGLRVFLRRRQLLALSPEMLDIGDV
jgi:hypothetical protein